MFLAIQRISTWRQAGKAGVILVVILTVYATCYLCMLNTSTIYSIAPYPAKKQALTGAFEVPVRYRFGGAATRTLFAPAHWLDRRIRPSLWTSSTDFKDAEVWEGP